MPSSTRLRPCILLFLIPIAIGSGPARPLAASGVASAHWSVPVHPEARVLAAGASPAPLRSWQAQTTSGRLRIVVPHEDAELLVGGEEVPGPGALRQFDTPPLAADETREYELVTKWQPNPYTAMTRMKVVRVAAGAEITVDLTRPDPNDRVEVRYVQTPPSVVAKMIELAGLRPDDVVYEPGCGDARITIAAVKAGARKGVGIDIDPARVAEARGGVEAAGLADRIEIRLGDALDVQDLGAASVVFLYMGDEFNLRIRPALWQQLAVGARVVSHRFTMGDWEPDTTALVEIGGRTFEVHRWTITEAVKAREP